MSQPPDYALPLIQASQMPTPDIGGQFIAGMQQQLAAQVAHAQLARQLTQQQQLDAARQQFITSPTPQNVRALAALDPQGFSAIKDVHAQQTADQQRQDLQDLTGVAGYLRAGQPDQAQTIVQRRIDAMKAAGQDTSSLDQLSSSIQSNPTAAKGMIDYSLAAILGPDKFGEAFPALEANERSNELQPGALSKQAADIAAEKATTEKTVQETSNLTHPLPETAATPGPDGNPIFYNPKGPPPVGAGGTSSSPALAALIPKLTASESGGDPTAKNPNSSATGAGQFINSTWLQQVKTLRPDLAAGKTDQQILAMRADPNLSAQVTTAYAQQNAATLQASGLPVNGATIAMAHKLGPGGAQSVLQANPNAPLSTVLPPEVIKANPQLAKMTAGQYAQSLASQFGTDPINTAPDPSATGDQFLATLPAARAKLIKAIANGDAPMPTGRSATTGAGQAIMQQVLQYDPTASAINLPTRQATRRGFTVGLQGQAINSANTVVGHLAGLSLAIDQLHNTPLDWVNGPAQFIGRNVGNADTQKSLANFNFYKTAVANELTKVFRGSNGAEADVQGWIKQLDAAKSPTELHTTVNSMIEGMKSRLDALGNEYSQGMGKTVDGLQLLSPHAQQLLQTLQSGGSQAPQIAVNPKTGERVVYDPVARAWKPA